MALACGEVPHFTTIAAFISGHAEKVEAIFEQVLLICDSDGLLGKELFAIDGCKMSSANGGIIKPKWRANCL